MAWDGSHSRGFPTSIRAVILARDQRCRCVGCPKCSTEGCRRRSTQADHVVPVAQGGTDHPSNGQGLCTPCHDVKSQAEAAAGRARNSPTRAPEPHPGLV